MLNLVDHERVTPQQIDGFADLRVIRVIRRMHGFVNRIMEDDTERIGHMSQETQPGDTDSMRFRIGQKVHGDRLR